MSENAPRYTHAEVKMLIMALDIFKPHLEQIYSKAPRKALEQQRELEILLEKLDAELDIPETKLEDPEPVEWYFKNRLAAYQWLRANGLKMGKTTFYEGIESVKPGFPRLWGKKRLSRADCEAFLRREMHNGGVRYVGPEAETLLWREQRVKTQIAELEAERMRFEAEQARESDEKLMQRKEAFLAYQIVEAQFMDAAQDEFWKQAPALIRRVGGDESRALEFCEELKWALFAARDRVGRLAHESFFAIDEDEDAPLDPRQD